MIWIKQTTFHLHCYPIYLFYYIFHMTSVYFVGNIYHIQQKIEASHFKGFWFEIDKSSFHLHTYSMYMNKKGIDMDFKCPFPVWFFWQAEEWDAHIYFIIGLQGNLSRCIIIYPNCTEFYWQTFPFATEDVDRCCFTQNRFHHKNWIT